MEIKVRRRIIVGACVCNSRVEIGLSLVLCKRLNYALIS